VHSLYRCRCIVGYRPYSSPDVIWFPERQIASVSLSMKWSPDALTMNMESGPNPATQFVNALSGSTVNITLSDPYMTGASWSVLFDTAAAYTNESLAAANHIILPKCAPGQVSTKENPCRPISGSSEIEDLGERSGTLARFAHVIVIFYYVVGGVTFSLETYFRVERFNIVHGKSYPKVTIAGVDPQTVTFNQNLQNFQMRENETLEENLKRIANDFGYRVSFCNSPEANYGQKYIMPVSFRERQVTGEEVLKKYINSVGGTYNKLPTKEYANKISVCTRANVNQGCSVFYLGKGLYEGYQINGAVERDTFNVNAEWGFNRDLGIDYDTKPIDGQKYTLEDTFPENRKAKLRGAKTSITSFPRQFEIAEKRLFETQVTSGYVWRGNGPEVSNTKVESINFYGVGVNNNQPIALLDGIVVAVSKDTGTVMIFTDYVFKVCEKDKKCTIRPIYQEVVNLTTVEPLLKVNERVSKNLVIGTATDDKKWFTRFFIKVDGAGYTNVTPSPNLVWSYAVPVRGLTDEEKKEAGIKIIEQSPSNTSTKTSGNFIGKVGDTGRSTAPHLHAEFEPKRPIQATDLDGIITIGGRPPSSWITTSPYGVQRSTGTHGGVDIAGNGIENQLIKLINGKVIDKGVEEGGFGNYVVIETPKGKIVLAHLVDGSTDGVSVGTSNSSFTSSKYSQGVQNSPTPVGATIETEFKGIPRALRIVPGRTVLKFISQYDKWIKEGRPSSIDPGVWIPERFSAWFIKTAEYKWDGDLRVKLTGVSDWGVAVKRTPIPKFEDFLVTENFQYKDYYGYIRGLGDLCWTLSDGKNSCDEFCKEAEEIREYLQKNKESGQRSADSPNVTSEFPPANCQYVGTKYNKTRVNAIINAARQGGINTKAGYAGVVGNALVESTTNLSPTAENPRTRAYGIFQWLDRRANLEEFARSQGKSPSDFNVQMQFFVAELTPGNRYFDSTSNAKTPGNNFLRSMNSSTSPEAAAKLFNDAFERASGQKDRERQQLAREIFNDLDCP
jgi:hypothetical protein